MASDMAAMIVFFYQHSFPLPLERHPKLLGDPHFTFHIHATVLKEQTEERFKILKTLAGTGWNSAKKNDHHDLQIGHIVEILLRCPNLFSESLQGRRLVATSHTKIFAMRIATGRYLRASSDHLHAETQLLPVANSLDMVCAQ